MSDCIFCKIVAGEIPADLVYQDESVVAFLDINPTAPGHVLVVPKKHSVDVSDIDDADLAAVARVGKLIGRRQKKVLGAAGFNLLAASGRAAQQSVFHTHFHVIPRYEDDGINVWAHGKAKPVMTPQAAFQLLKDAT